MSPEKGWFLGVQVDPKPETLNLKPETLNPDKGAGFKAHATPVVLEFIALPL